MPCRWGIAGEDRQPEPSEERVGGCGGRFVEVLEREVGAAPREGDKANGETPPTGE